MKSVAFFAAARRKALLCGMNGPKPFVQAACAILFLLLSPSYAASASDDIRSEWQSFKNNYVLDDGRVVDRENGTVSHTEGQGWAMLVAVSTGDQATFDRIWLWTNTHLRRRDVALFSWRYDPNAAIPVSDPNNATDGDIAIAWALMQAGERWANAEYAAQSSAIRNAIRGRLVRNVGGYTVLSPGLSGFAHGDRQIVNLSYWILPAFQDFHVREPDRGWDLLIRDYDRILQKVTADGASLPPDWLDLNRDGSMTPCPQWPARFGFDAVRIPLYLAWAGSDGEMLTRMSRAWFGASELSSIPAWIDIETGASAPYPASFGMRRIWLLAAYSDRSPDPAQSESYYSDALALLAHIAQRERLVRVGFGNGNAPYLPSAYAEALEPRDLAIEGSATLLAGNAGSFR